MPQTESTFSESAWARGRSDAKAGLADWRFWAVQVFVGGPLTVYDPWVGLLFVAGITMALWVGATASAPIKQRNEARALITALQSQPALAIMFPPEANLPHKISHFRTVTKFLFSAKQLAPPHPCEYKFYIALVNNTTKTIRNAGIRITWANIPPRPLTLDLIEKNTQNPRIELSPKSTEFFRLGAVVRREEDDKDIDEHKVADGVLMAQIAELADTHTRTKIGIIIPHSQGQEPLLRNDGQVLRVVARGDDVAPAEAEIILDMKEAITVNVKLLDTH